MKDIKELRERFEQWSAMSRFPYCSSQYAEERAAAALDWATNTAMMLHEVLGGLLEQDILKVASEMERANNQDKERK